MKILIVEDDETLSRILREYLQCLDHEKVQVCLTGEEACTAIELDSFDCVFIDIRLPDTDGFQLLGVIKGRDPTVPVVMMSGYPSMEYTIEAMRKGASDFLTKPFTLQDLALALERITKERKLLLENLSLQLECRTQKQLEVVNRELEERMQEQVALFSISKRIDEARSSKDLFPCIAKLASYISSAKQVGLFILPPEQNCVLPVAGRNLLESELGGRIASMQAERLREIIDKDASHVWVGAKDIAGSARMGDSASNGGKFACWPIRIRGELFGFLTTSKNGGPASFSSTEERLLDFLTKKAALAIENMALYESLIGNFYGILKSLVNALEAKDPYTGKHSERVTRYALRIAEVMDCSMAEIEALRTIGYLHDIGKIGIADSILNKPGPLSTEEYELVKKHPAIGDSIVADLGFSAEERSIIRHHHESWNGKGYPDQLAGQDIPLLARIVAVADAFDAMTSRRAYRMPMSVEKAGMEIEAYRGRQFDPQVVDAFLDSGQNDEREGKYAGEGIPENPDPGAEGPFQYRPI